MKNILAILVALLQLLLSDVIIQIVFGSSLLWDDIRLCRIQT